MAEYTSTKHTPLRAHARDIVVDQGRDGQKPDQGTDALV